MSESSFFTYKGRPLVRSGNTIYYGKMSDEFVIVMQIMVLRRNRTQMLQQEL